MPSQIKIGLGQYSDKGRKAVNQDFHGAYLPCEPLLSTKGIAVAIADGISSSQVSQIASETSIRSFLDDYACTSEAWSVKKSAMQVLSACNSWLLSQTRQSEYRYDKNKGYVTTFSAVILKSNIAHLIHIGDSRIYLLKAKQLKQLTTDHRIQVSSQQSHLTKALGVQPHLDVEYNSLKIDQGDVLILATDGIYEHVSADFLKQTINNNLADLNQAAKQIAQEAYQAGSQDNLTIQIIHVEKLPNLDASQLYQTYSQLPFAPELKARMLFDGYRIIRALHISSRSHIYLATDESSQTQVVLKIPSVDLRNEAAYLERFLLEQWIANRLDSPFILKTHRPNRAPNFIYIAYEYVNAQTLTQWMLDNPTPTLKQVRSVLTQIAKGLQAFHRLEMLHQDIRPDNIMIDDTGSIKIIDFGAVRVAGIDELNSQIEQPYLLGTAQYMAPEYFVGEQADTNADLYSLAAIGYQMLTQRLPYGDKVARARHKKAQNQLIYKSLLTDKTELPHWIDPVFKKALAPNPAKRYDCLSEFIFDLHQPNQSFLAQHKKAMIERNPIAFWQCVSALLFCLSLYLLAN